MVGVPLKTVVWASKCRLSAVFWVAEQRGSVSGDRANGVDEWDHKRIIKDNLEHKICMLYHEVVTNNYLSWDICHSENFSRSSRKRIKFKVFEFRLQDFNNYNISISLVAKIKISFCNMITVLYQVFLRFYGCNYWLPKIDYRVSPLHLCVLVQLIAK